MEKMPHEVRLLCLKRERLKEAGHWPPDIALRMLAAMRGNYGERLGLSLEIRLVRSCFEDLIWNRHMIQGMTRPREIREPTTTRRICALGRRRRINCTTYNLRWDSKRAERGSLGTRKQ